MKKVISISEPEKQDREALFAYQSAKILHRLFNNDVDMTKNFTVRNTLIAVKAGNHNTAKGRQMFVVLRVTAYFHEVSDGGKKHHGRFFARTVDDVAAG